METPESIKAKAGFELYDLFSPALGGRPLAIDMSIGRAGHATGRGHLPSINVTLNELLHEEVAALNPEVARFF
ncbi:MAG: hypothetical protein LBL30_00650 [Holosporales bacterium]|jgi:hypothetical protein|nr:hypothetical protein [Holosporales bacterium]